MVAKDSANSTATAKPAQGNAQNEVFKNLCAVALKATNAQLDKFALRLADALMQLSDGSTDAKQASQTFNSANLLKKNLYAFHFLASAAIQKALSFEIEVLQSPLNSVRTKSTESLSLVPYADMDKKLLLSNMARPLETANADQLTALRLRMAALLEREEISHHQDPFRPDNFVTAINDAWCEFNPDEETHGLVLPLLTQEVFLDLAPVYAALNSELIAAGVLPELADFYNIKKTTGSAESKKKNDGLDPAALRQLRQLFSPSSAISGMPSMPSGAAPLPSFESMGESGVPMIPGIPVAGVPAIPGLANATAYAAPLAAMGQNQGLSAAVSGSQLLNFLSGLQSIPVVHQSQGFPGLPVPTPMLANIKATAPQGAMTSVDESTIDLLTKIFDVVFRDRNIPTEIKGLIGFLQVPVLKAALVDKDFFFKEEHPARRLIELLTKTSLGWDQSKGQDDPLYQTIKRNVNRVQQDFDRQASVFSDVVSDLESFLQQEETQSAEALSAPIAQALKQEKLAQATKSAKNEVALRIGTGEVVAFVETFLENKWVSVLTLAYSIKEEKPRAVESALKTMDDLIWSVKPKITMEERKELIAKLPSMLSMLNKWLNLVKLDDAERLQFFAELAECHASIVRAPLEMSPQRRLEIAMEVAKQAAERRLQKRAEQEAELAPIVDDFSIHVENLERGMWLEFTSENAPVKKVKLSWVSPLRSLFIFSSRDKSESFSLSAEDLARALRENRVQVIQLSGMVDRAIVEALEDSGANDPQIHEKSAA